MLFPPVSLLAGVEEKIPAWQVSHQCGWWLIALFKLQLCQSQNLWILILDLLLEKVSADETGPFYWCFKSGISAAASSYYWKERLLWLLALLCVCLVSSFPVFLFPSSESSQCLHWVYHTGSRRWQADTQSELITASNELAGFGGWLSTIPAASWISWRFQNEIGIAFLLLQLFPLISNECNRSFHYTWIFWDNFLIVPCWKDINMQASVQHHDFSFQ